MAPPITCPAPFVTTPVAVSTPPIAAPTPLFAVPVTAPPALPIVPCGAFAATGRLIGILFPSGPNLEGVYEGVEGGPRTTRVSSSDFGNFAGVFLIGVDLDVGAAGVFVRSFGAESGADDALFVVDATGTGFLVPIGVRIGLFTEAGAPLEDTTFLTGVTSSVEAGIVLFATGTGFFVPMGVLADLVGVAEAAAGANFFRAGLEAAGVFVGAAAFFATVGDAFV